MYRWMYCRCVCCTFYGNKLSYSPLELGTGLSVISSVRIAPRWQWLLRLGIWAHLEDQETNSTSVLTESLASTSIPIIQYIRTYHKELLYCMSETSLIRHSMGPENNVGLGGCWIMECLLPYLCMVTVPHIMVGLERMLDYTGVRLARFRCISE